MTIVQSDAANEYLMAIWLLAYPVGEQEMSKRGPKPTAAARIADQMNVSRPSAGEMLKRLEGEGLVVRGDKKEALLTSKGRFAAMRTVRRQRVVERLLTDVLGYEGAEAYKKSHGLDSRFDDEMVERTWNQLGKPERCPHGYPIDADHELRENPTLKPLNLLESDTSAQIVRIAEHNEDLMNFYYEAGLTPEVELKVIAGVDKNSGIFSIEVGEEEIVLTENQANGLYVRPEGIPVVPSSPECWAGKVKSA